MSETHPGTHRGGSGTSRIDDLHPEQGAGWVAFASIMLVLVGLFNVLFGLVALFEQDYYLVGSAGLLVFDLTGWGWIHLIIGGAAVLAGVALTTGATWARAVAAGLAGLNALAQVAFLPAFPAWSLVAIALDVLVIWAVVVHAGKPATR
ncbi:MULTISPECIES: DUF7144 family membrane protein [Prauserella salsuginis group]|uniref:DUF7144 domain-containing protein n=2 Tax=Prauserella salsuginis group TaxID=2893672 RepID=A0ABW6G409_9PSEU|nr:MULTISPECIES: hypothetical protein [Prauserella salsuginis group]MBB3664892.1 putative membrane protein [Prauserella sediminis]MCR3718361.1 hypothetical protein [Prauserella flava]MCR3732931.1 hypothetical protein [Prauserella salsuginis]